MFWFPGFLYQMVSREGTGDNWNHIFYGLDVLSHVQLTVSVPYTESVIYTVFQKKTCDQIFDDKLK